jgi:hypothetical protein
MHEEMFNILSHKGNINQNHTEIPLTPVRVAIIKINNKCWRGCGLKEPLHTVGRNAN